MSAKQTFTKIADELKERYADLLIVAEGQAGMIAEANKILAEANTRPSHKWIINNLDKAEVIEYAFKKLEHRLKRLKCALCPMNKDCSVVNDHLDCALEVKP